MTMKLDRNAFFEVVRVSPLVSVDLVVRDPSGRTLVGLRNNEPAKDCWFVPGGRICKGERITDAFERVDREELGAPVPHDSARLLGVYEHLYETNFAGHPDVGTHYIALAHELTLDPATLDLERSQHRAWRWITPAEALADAEVHANTKAYFANEC